MRRLHLPLGKAASASDPEGAAPFGQRGREPDGKIHY
jgi:hypothetical protein